MGRKRKEPHSAVCAECGVVFQTVRAARFCSTAHKTAFSIRMGQRGRVIAPYVMGWIAGRGGGHSGTHPVVGTCLKEITAITRDWIDEDKAAGRPPVIDYVEAMLAEGFLYCDRRRR